jgi:hypothetical protein
MDEYFYHNYGKKLKKLIVLTLLLASTFSISAYALETISELAAKGFEVKTSFISRDGSPRIVIQKKESIFICHFVVKGYTKKEWQCVPV